MSFKTDRIKPILMILVFQFLFLQGYSQTDPFANYLSSIPKVIKVISDSTMGTESNLITVKKFVFSSRDGINSIFVIMAFPKKEGKYPAMLFLHGGGGKAETMFKNVKSYALRGYVTISLDQPGICKTEDAPYSSGPWTSRVISDARFDLENGPSSCILVDGLVADIEAFNFLASQPNVDATNIGITGTSWGGYATTMLSGLLGKRVKAAYSVFGSGFYDKGSNWLTELDILSPEKKNAWLTYLDAGRRAKNITAPYFVESPTNDMFFWPAAVTATLNEINGTKNHTWTANKNHKRQPSGIEMQALYFDYYLKGLGRPFGKVDVLHATYLPDSTYNINIKLNTPMGIAIDTVQVFYSEKAEKWQKRVWLPLPAIKQSTDNYKAVLPGSLANKNVDYYAIATDSRKVVFSSLMYESATKK